MQTILKHITLSRSFPFFLTNLNPQKFIYRILKFLLSDLTTCVENKTNIFWTQNYIYCFHY